MAREDADDRCAMVDCSIRQELTQSRDARRTGRFTAEAAAPDPGLLIQNEMASATSQRIRGTTCQIESVKKYSEATISSKTLIRSMRTSSEPYSRRTDWRIVFSMRVFAATSFEVSSSSSRHSAISRPRSRLRGDLACGGQRWRCLCNRRRTGCRKSRRANWHRRNARPDAYAPRACDGRHVAQSVDGW